MMPYERFDAWHACYALTLATYRITAQFPSHERYGLVSQMRRAAFSTAANIAEGAATRARRISTVSRYESGLAVRTLRGDSSREGSFIHRYKQGQEISEACSRAGKVTMGLYKAVQSTIRRSADP